MVSQGAETGLYLSGFEAWEQVEGRLLAFLMTGPLYWLGAVACGTLDEAGGDGLPADSLG